MARNETEFSVNIPVPGEEPFRGKFRVKVRLSYRDILAMDGLRRQLLGPLNGGEADGVAQLIASAVAKIRTHATETPSWWTDNGAGLDFEDINVVLSVLEELKKVETEYYDRLKKDASEAATELKKGEVK